MEDSDPNWSDSHTDDLSQDTISTKKKTQRSKHKASDSQVTSSSKVFSMKNALKTAKLNKTSILQSEDSMNDGKLNKEIESLRKQVRSPFNCIAAKKGLRIQ